MDNDKLAPALEPDDLHVPGCFGCLQRRLHFFPIITTAWLGVAFITTWQKQAHEIQPKSLTAGTDYQGVDFPDEVWIRPFIIYNFNSIWRTEPDFPYISYTATGDPERTIFGQFVNIGAVLLCSNGVIRYLHNKQIFVTSMEERRWHIVNLVALGLMITSSIGLSMVGNFPTSVEKVPHYLGAALAFGFGVAYCWVQTKISWRMRKKRLAGQDRSRMPLIQFINCIFATIFLFSFGINASIYKSRKNAGDPTETGYLRGIYLTSSISEWMLAISYSTFILTFIPLFSGLKLKAATVEMKESENQDRRDDMVISFKPTPDE